MTKIIILDELDVEYIDVMWDNPVEMNKRFLEAGDKLIKVLEVSDSVTDMERKFREQALKNESAAERAREILDELNNILLGETPEVVANFIALLPHTTQIAHNIVNSMGIREFTETVPKAVAHQMYIRLREAQAKYVDMCSLKGFTLVKNFPGREKMRMLPSKSGSYAPKKHSLPIYSFIWEDERYSNPFTLVRHMGLTIDESLKYYDIIQIFKDHADVEVEEV